ncbi:response regulator transcription factor [Hespellia stercorisuis]|uniref:Stage 0 sporulation protein A homolog n=1 Tax=Hespellia stercorisuis DSM 15480 TaxID=1121950 RepID=A0A1M6MXZ9_9FIRM|nr:response regulator transcription factor [Hespellia stercorisuis]SHJ88250.1 DNA-binding response regulator, OmpR family, contains REC and winged-helix (wHTH) domain [Hespellia stercorisuis DSM 15480]
MKYNILVAEDDKDIVELLEVYLESVGYQVFVAYDGAEALAVLNREDINMAVLDIMMPKLDGYAVTRKIRQKSNIPILVLSAKSEDEDKILGLNLGADDYIAKPFNPLEIIARVNANLRRYYQLGEEKKSGNQFVVGDLVLDMEKVALKKKGRDIPLTATEFKLLAVFMGHPGQVFTKMQLYEQSCGEYIESDANTMMVHISKLREKIEDDTKNPEYIKTVRGVGYKLERH